MEEVIKIWFSIDDNIEITPSKGTIYVCHKGMGRGKQSMKEAMLAIQDELGHTQVVEITTSEFNTFKSVKNNI